MSRATPIAADSDNQRHTRVAFKQAIFDNQRRFEFELATTAWLLEGLIREVTSTESAG